MSNLSLSDQLRAAATRSKDFVTARRAFHTADQLDLVTSDPDIDVSEMVATWRNAHQMLKNLQMEG